MEGDAFLGALGRVWRASHDLGLDSSFALCSFSQMELLFKVVEVAPSGDRIIEAYLAPLHRTKWFVYCKRPFAGPEQVLAYLSRYTHRVAISNSRLIAADATGVHLQVQGLPDQGARPLQDHDAQAGRVHPPLPHPRLAKRVPRRCGIIPAYDVQ
jgi:hypothetical protein